MNKVIRIDASSLTNNHCFLKFYRTVVEGYRVPKEGVKLHFGSAWHIFREHLAKSKGDYLTAIRHGCNFLKEKLSSNDICIDKDEEFMTPAFLTLICLKYIETYKDRSLSFGDFEHSLDAKGNPLVEVTFSIKVYSADGIDIYVQGTLDEIGTFKRSGLAGFGDDKSTSKSPKTNFLEEFAMKPQLLTYAWAIWFLANNGTIEGNPLEKFKETRIGGFINGVFLHKDIDRVVFERSDIFWFSTESIISFDAHIRELASCVAATYLMCEKNPNTVLKKEGKYNGTCSGNWGKCMFWGACNAPDTIAEQAVLDRFFIRRDYKPMEFRKSNLT